jgi:large subunit ribosomal protein L19
MTKTSIKLSPVSHDSVKKNDIRSGDTIRVWSKIQEKGKTRLQAFEGLVLARKHGSEIGATITVRKISNGVGVERIFPLHSPAIDRIEIVKRAKTRRSKLYFLKDKTSKEVRRKLKALGFNIDEKVEIAPEDMMEEEVVEETTEKVEEATEEKEETPTA